MSDQHGPVQRMFRDDILKMTGYQAGEQPQGGKTIKLNTNENPYCCSPKVVQAIQSVAAEGLSKYPDSTASAFRNAASSVLGVPPDWLICGNGSDEILTMVTRAFVGEGQTVRWPYPSYVLYPVLTQIQAGLGQPVAFSKDWSLTEEFFTMEGEPSLVFLANPNSPSGTQLGRDQILQLADALPCPILIDEAYADFAGVSCVDLVAENEQILISRTLSKSYALAGMRFGDLVAQPPIIKQLLKVKDSYNCDALSIAGATAAIADQEWLVQNVAKIRSTRERMSQQLEAVGFDVTPSSANFIWCRHRERSSQDLYRLLKQNQLLVRYMNFDQWGDGIRITVGTDDQLDALITILNSIL